MRSMPKISVLVAALGIALLLLCWADAAHAQAGLDNLPDQMAELFRQKTQHWVSVLGGYARRLFFVLATIELTISMTRAYYQQGGTFEGIASVLIERLLFLGFWSTVLLYAPAWMPQLIQSLRNLGGAAIGVTLSPSDVLDRGLSLTADLIAAAFERNLLEGFGLLFPLLIIALTFVFATAEVLAALIDSYLIASAGILLLGFGGSTWTAGIAHNYLRYAFAAGIHLMVTQLVAGVGLQIVIDVGNSVVILDDGFLSAVLWLMAVAILFAYLVRRIPAAVSSIVTGAPVADSGAALIATTAASAHTMRALPTHASAWLGGPTRQISAGASRLLAAREAVGAATLGAISPLSSQSQGHRAPGSARAQQSAQSPRTSAQPDQGTKTEKKPTTNQKDDKS